MRDENTKKIDAIRAEMEHEDVYEQNVEEMRQNFQDKVYDIVEISEADFDSFKEQLENPSRGAKIACLIILMVFKDNSLKKNKDD